VSKKRVREGEGDDGKGREEEEEGGCGKQKDLIDQRCLSQGTACLPACQYLYSLTCSLAQSLVAVSK